MARPPRFSCTLSSNNHNSKRLLSSNTNDSDNTRRRPQLKPGSHHWGEVKKIVDFGAFVRIDGCQLDGLVHISEISADDTFIYNVSDHLRVGQRVKVVVLDSVAGTSGQGKLRLSTKRVKPTIPDNFEPATVAVFGLPMELYDKKVEDVFQQHGCVVDVRLLPSFRYPDEDVRKIAYVTYRDRAEAINCIRNRKQVPIQIGYETYTYKVKVKMAKKQNFKKRLQARIDKEYEELMMNQDPEMNRLEEHYIRELIPW